MESNQNHFNTETKPEEVLKLEWEEKRRELVSLWKLPFGALSAIAMLFILPYFNRKTLPEL